MIDWIKSVELNGVSEDDLKDWFKRFPNSGKKIIAACDKCGKKRKLEFRDYSDLCKICWGLNNTGENNGMYGKTGDKSPRYGKSHTEETKKKIGIGNKGKLVGDKNPSKRLDVREKLIEHGKILSEEYRGGYDIVNHHMIYDRSDLSKHTMKMTRSMHSRLHRLFQIHGIKVPHINIKEV